MTREEAIKELKNTDRNICYDEQWGIYFTNRWLAAHEMAIAALREQEPVTDSHQLTNADHIRSMTDEELASFLCSVGPDEMEEDLWLAWDIIPDYDQYKVEDWLKQPYKEET